MFIVQKYNSVRYDQNLIITNNTFFLNLVVNLKAGRTLLLGEEERIGVRKGRTTITPGLTQGGSWNIHKISF